MAALPTGTITFLMTDLEGSVRLWEQHRQTMAAALERHDALAAEVIGQHGGSLVKYRGEGDSLFAVFDRASCAVSAACNLQQLFLSESWPTPRPLRVRMALHSGEAALRDGDYFGPAPNRCARLRAAAHGGQVLLSSVAQALAQEAVLPEVSIRDLGLYQLRDLERPERVFQALHPDLPAEFPSLRGAKRLSEDPLTLSDRQSAELEAVMSALTAIQNGDLRFHLPVHRAGPARELALALNARLDFLNALTHRLLGAINVMDSTERLGEPVHEPEALGRWRDILEITNRTSRSLGEQFGELRRVVTALGTGDFSQRIAVRAWGNMGELWEILNGVIDRLEAFALDHLRITREVGTEGKFGGQGGVPGLSGTWKEMWDSLNQMSGSLTVQVRDINTIVDCLIRGDFTRKVTVEAHGETEQLTQALNRLVDLLDLLAEEVTRMASGEPAASGAGRMEQLHPAGTWQEMFDHLNTIAALLPV